MADLPTKTEQVTVDRTTATCALCGREAVVVRGRYPSGIDYLESAHDPLDPNTQPLTVATNYGDASVRYFIREVFVEKFDTPGVFTKQSLLVCNGCSDGVAAPLLIQIEIDRTTEATPK